MSVNLKGKRGDVTKTVQVYSNDPSRPVTILTVRAHVRDSLHMKEYQPREIFNTPCSRCHVDRGRGKQGRELFYSDCMMCHGDRMGASRVQTMMGEKREHLVDAVRNGVSGSSMPGWYTGKGGPLSDKDIDSLVDFLSDHATR